MELRRVLSNAGVLVARITPIVVAGFVCSSASATWSILIVDTRTGEIAVGSATCVPGINLRANTPVLILGKGAVTAQSAVDTSGGNRARIFEGFAQGLTPDQILADLAANDTGHGNRQYGFVDTAGNALTYSGVDNADWAGGVTGRIEMGEPGPADDIVYSVQGNILTGEPVVAMAEQAIIGTPGDLAEKLMAGMEAAYAFGGDGRCSCSNTDPTGCGAPPVDGFVRSADVGYMLVGRLGDREQSGSFGVVGSGFGVGEILIDDFNLDGKPDLVSLPTFSGGLVSRENITPGAGGPLVFGNTPIEGSFSLPDYAGAGDIDGDGDPDIVLLGGAIFVAINNGDGTFQPLVNSSLFNSPEAGVLGEFDASSPGLELVTFGLGAFSTYTFDGTGAATRVADQPGVTLDGADHIAAIPGGVLIHSGFDNAFIPFTADGDGTFSEGDPIDAFFTGDRFETGDLNGDGVFDIVSQAGASGLTALLSDGMGGYDEVTGIAVLNPGPQFLRDWKVADTDGDGDDDIAMLARFGRFAVATDDGMDGIVNGPARRVLEGTRLSADDLTGDGIADFVTTEGNVLGAYTNDGSGIPNDDRGFAGGDYFLELNVANAPDPGYDDPVLQLRDEFDAWRADRVGVPDGSQSTLGDFPERVFATGTTTTVQFGVTVRDFAGGAVTGLGSDAFSIEAPSGLARPLEIGSVSESPGDAGTYQITAQPTGEIGESQLLVRITAGTPSGSTVSAVVQPAPSYIGARSMADFDHNGVLDLADLVAFITAFNAGDLAADLAADGVLDLNDIGVFVQEFLAGS